MKTFLLIFSSLFFCLLFLPVLCVAGEVESSPVFKLQNIEDIFISFAALVAVIPIITEFLKKIIFIPSYAPRWVIIALSWITGLTVTMIGWLLQFGFLEGILWYHALLWGFAASLAANGIADTKLIQQIFTIIISLFKKKTK